MSRDGLIMIDHQAANIEFTCNSYEDLYGTVFEELAYGNSDITSAMGGVATLFVPYDY